MDLTAHLDNTIRYGIAGGKFFSSDPYELLKNIEELISLNAVSFPANRRVKAIVAPHSSYELTKSVIGTLYSVLMGKEYDEIFILGSTTFSEIEGVDVADFLNWETPLGPLSRSKRALQVAHDDDLLEQNLFNVNNTHHQIAHTIEIQLPLLKFALGDDIQLIPMLVGSVSARLAAKHLDKYVDENDLLVISSELSQNYPLEVAKELDKFTIDSLISPAQNSDYRKLFKECTNSGGLAILSEMAMIRGWKAELVKYQNLEDMAKGGERSSGYAGLVYYE